MDFASAEKSCLRDEMRRRRRALSLDVKKQADAEINARLAALLANFPKSSTVAVYMPSSDEVDIMPFVGDLLSSGYILAAPRWNGETYEMALISKNDLPKLVVGPMRILQPPPESPAVSSSLIDLWIVPALAYSSKGDRLGYGGGWYDRMLSSAGAQAIKVGVAYAFQIVENIPTSNHDIQVSSLVTSVTV